MSWSVAAVGRAPLVAALIAKNIADIKCSEPEETIKNDVGHAIATALAAFGDGLPVRVEASGSQSDRGNGVTTNQLSVKIEPIWGFLE